LTKISFTVSLPSRAACTAFSALAMAVTSSWPASAATVIRALILPQTCTTISTVSSTHLAGSYSGQVERAPEMFQKLGLEWAYRLMKEPNRVGRMARLPLVLVKALKGRFTKGE